MHSKYLLTEYVRLVDGQHSAEGRVEMYNPNTGLYGAIYSSGWDLSDAQVICKMLGYPYAIYARSGSGIYGSGSWYSVAYSFGCSGTENDIYDCTFQDYYSSTSSTAAAICSGKENCYIDERIQFRAFIIVIYMPLFKADTFSFCFHLSHHKIRALVLLK